MPGPPSAVFAAAAEQFAQAKYGVTTSENAVYASHSAGVSITVYATPAGADESEVEVIYAGALLGADFLRQSEAATLKGISDQVELQQLRRKSQGREGGGLGGGADSGPAPVDSVEDILKRIQEQ